MYIIIVYMVSKKEVISQVYQDLSGYGSMHETTQYAKTIGNPIKISDVKERFDNHATSKCQV